MDIVIPIVFPDYLIAVNTPRTKIDILPWVDIDNFWIPATKNKVAELGHAGILFINGTSGTSKYYEYGRYDKANLGIVRKIPIPNISISENKPSMLSLKKTLRQISGKAGQGGRISGVYIEINNKYKAMLDYAKSRQKQNRNSKRKPYDIVSNSCIHFVKELVQAAGVSTPWMIDPRPNSYIGEFRDDFLDLDYNRKKNELIIENIGKF